MWLQTPTGSTISHFETLTNVADERELRTFNGGGAVTFKWRVRAVRQLGSNTLPNGVSITKYGPYSQTFTTSTRANPSSGALRAVSAASDVVSTPSSPKPHQLTPGFAWTGAVAPNGTGSSAFMNTKLWRVYVYSDKQCVNLVMTGSVTGSPAWAPRLGQPLTLPTTLIALSGLLQGAAERPARRRMPSWPTAHR